jgi:hypothetical protein
MRPPKNDFDPQEQEFLALVELPQCPDVGLLYSAREGVLPDEQARLVTEHLAQCEVCRTLFADMESIEFGTPTPVESMNIRERISRSAPGAFEPTKPEKTWIRKRWWVPALAMAACAVLAVVLLRQKSDAPPAPQIALSKPLPEVQLDKLPIHVDSSTLLATRGAGNASQPSPKELVKALSKYQKDDYAAAAQQLKTLAAKYSQDGTVRLYLGVSELFLDQNEDAATELMTAKTLNDDGRLADTKWYLAIAELRLKQPNQALPILHELCEGKSTYSQRACAVESSLK